MGKRKIGKRLRVPTKCVILVLAITLVASLATASQMEKYGCGGEANPLWRWVWEFTGSVPAFVIVSQTTTALLMVALLKLRALEDARIQVILVGVASLSATNDSLSLAGFFSFPLLILVSPLVAVGAGFCWSKVAKFNINARQLPLFTLAAYGAFFLIIVIGASIPYHEEWEESGRGPPTHIVEWLENRGFAVEGGFHSSEMDVWWAVSSEMTVHVNFENGILKSVGAVKLTLLKDPRTVTYSARLEQEFRSWDNFVSAYNENTLFPTHGENLEVVK